MDRLTIYNVLFNGFVVHVIYLIRVVYTEFYLRMNLCFIKRVMPYHIHPVRTIFATAPRFNASMTYFRTFAGNKIK